MARIFVSYARGTRSVVEQLVADLRASGHDPYFDEVLAGGQRWWDTLLDKIEQCDVFMPAISTAYITSNPCRLEAEYAHQLRRPILAVALEPVSNRLFPAYIAETQWISYAANRDGILALMRGLHSVPAASPFPAVRPPRPTVPISYLDTLRDKVEAPALTRDEQLLLVSECRTRLRGEEADDVRRLLARLLARPDLFQQVAAEIDGLLGSRDVVQGPAGSFAAPASVYAPPAPPPHQQHAVSAAAAGSASGPGPVPGNGAPWSTFATPVTTKPQNYLGWSIAVTLLCCLPIGAAGIYFATQVDKRWLAGDPAGAAKASGQAKMWTTVAAVLGGLFILLVLVASAGGSGS